MKRVLDDIIDLISPVKHFHRNITCLLDLPDAILLIICRYMSTFDVLHCFYTPERTNMRLHRLISDYYTKINLDEITYDKYQYFNNLFCNSNNSVRPESLRLSNEHVSCLIGHYFSSITQKTIEPIFINLIHLTLIDCSEGDLDIINRHHKYLTKLQSLHVTIRKSEKKLYRRCMDKYDTLISQFLFSGRMLNLASINIKPFDGLSLYKCLISHQGLRYVNIILQTIDDLYILLNGLVPNVETMIVQLFQSRLLSCHRPESKPLCPRLIDFTLLENCSEMDLDNIECVLGYMPDLRKLTLSIRDTPDPRFSHGLIMESVLNKLVPKLEKFDYTMTHRINDKTLIEDFIRWSRNIVFYEIEDIKWVHIFSIPWPSTRQDKRELPVVNGGFNISVTSDVKSTLYLNHVNIKTNNEMLEINERFRQIRQLTTCLSIDILLPERISKLILSNQTSVTSINSIPQPNIRHLIVERRLSDESEISILAHQFPHVKYLELLFPLNETLFRCCFKTLFNLDDTIEKRCFWSELVNFHTRFGFEQLSVIPNDENIHYWLIKNTDLKFHPIPFHANCLDSTLSIWL